jgi:PAS domain S-box-containing protein
MSWNQAAVRLFGYKTEEIIGRSILTLIPPELHYEEDEILRNLREGKRIEHYETIRLRKDGGKVSVSVTISVLESDTKPNSSTMSSS